MIGALETMDDRDLAARQIDQAPGDEERRNAPRPLLVQRDRGIVNAAEAADARTDQHAGFDLVLVSPGRPIGVAQGLGRRGQGVDDEIVDAALFLGLHPIVGIVGVRRAASGNLRRDLAGDVGDFEILDAPGRRVAREQPAPSGFDPAGQGRDHAQSRDHDAFHCRSLGCGRLRDAASGRDAQSSRAPDATRAGLSPAPFQPRAERGDPAFAVTCPRRPFRETSRRRRPSRWSRPDRREFRRRTLPRRP